MSVDLSINPGVELRKAQLELQQFRRRLAIAAAFVLIMFLFPSVFLAHRPR